MSVGDIMVITIVVAFFVCIVAFFAGVILGYETRVHEEQDKYRSVPKHWRGHTSHKGCTIFSPVVKEGGIK